ncbi:MULTISPECIES: cobalt transporter CbiM [unclassified Coleofasciculus]|uniref:cobalt transporter CbiM n=1 Tax=unclassified Coleofasciculus TaxID=2692782 RepID=UPI0018805190|nr:MULTISPECIES: cobalt transporter CbiM [unclassified Coleofasciculus]MBE9128910.1 cobalt transporter CbiM [Coleofasciculus sp. LEGE 07081]MBE9151648.1 cobalt transporter CbiM [Coleofasciculus sp. LEGE 07092]
MHIPDGFINPSVCVAGYAVTGGMTWYCLHKINKDKNPQAKIPKAALLTVAFFVVNLINIPIPPSSLHFVLNGLMGVVLGYYAFPAILIALFFQGVMFQHGGISTLGVNGIIMGFPALLAYYIFRLRYQVKIEEPKRTKIFAFLAGAGGVMIAATIFSVVVITTIPGDINAEMERNAIYAALAVYTIPAVLEGIFTMMLVSFLDRVKPELLENR